MNSSENHWAVIGIATFARAKDFKPFALIVTTGHGIEMYIVPHRACIRVKRDRKGVVWKHDKNSVVEINPRHILSVELGVEAILCRARQLEKTKLLPAPYSVGKCTPRTNPEISL